MKRTTKDSPPIPDKVYFRIGEVSQLVGVDTHVLRYWESEFTQIKPFRGKSKQRLYRRKDVENLLLIKELLHSKGYTISGARKCLKTTVANQPTGVSDPTVSTAGPVENGVLLASIKTELEGILEQLGHTKQNEREQRVDSP